MKLRNFLAAAAVVALAACETPYRATDTTTVIVPENTQRAFAEQYPNGVNVIWSSYDPNVVVISDWELSGWPVMDATDYQVRFDENNETYYAYYDVDGTWVGTVYVVKDYTTLPQAVNTAINNLYPLYTITSVNKESHKDKVAYEVVLKRDETTVKLLMDPEGNVIKQKTKTP
jgi:hypothetical protein